LGRVHDSGGGRADRVRRDGSKSQPMVQRRASRSCLAIEAWRWAMDRHSARDCAAHKHAGAYRILVPAPARFWRLPEKTWRSFVVARFSLTM